MNRFPLVVAALLCLAIYVVNDGAPGSVSVICGMTPDVVATFASPGS